MTPQEADQRALAAMGKAIRLWSDARFDEAIDAGMSRAEALHRVNAMMADPVFVEWVNRTRASLLRWFLAPDAAERLQ